MCAIGGLLTALFIAVTIDRYRESATTTLGYGSTMIAVLVTWRALHLFAGGEQEPIGEAPLQDVLRQSPQDGIGSGPQGEDDWHPLGPVIGESHDGGTE